MRGKKAKRSYSARKEWQRTALEITIAVLILILMALIVYALSLERVEVPEVTLPSDSVQETEQTNQQTDVIPVETTEYAEDTQAATPPGTTAHPDEDETKPTEEPADQPTTKPTTKPTPKPTTKPDVDPTTEPTAEPTEEPTTAPSVEPSEPPATEPVVAPTAPSEPPEETQVPGDGLYLLGQGLEITDLGSYSGSFLEDGTNDQVANVLMIVVTNFSEDTLQYAQIQLTSDQGTAYFSVSTLPPGASALLLEENRMHYSKSMEFTAGSAQNVVFFDEAPSAHTDVLKIQGMDGALNVTNISNSDIQGDIVIYYKNYYDGLYYGGITYRARIQGGLKAGEIRQMMTGHFLVEGSVLMFVTYNAD